MGSLRSHTGAVALLLFGCGGMSQSGSPTGSGAGGTSSEPDPITSAGRPAAPDAGAPVTGDECRPFQPLLRIEPTWESAFATAASVPGRFFELSPDGSRLAAPTGQYLLDQAEYSVLDGSVLVEDLPAAEARDDAWRRELRGAISYYPEYANEVVDRDTGERLWARQAHFPVAALSGDGERVLTVACDGSPGIERQDIATGVVSRVALSVGTAGCAYATPPPVQVTRSGAVAVIARAPSDVVTVVDFERGTAMDHALDDASATGNAVLALELSPSETMIAVTAVGRPLRVLGFPGLERRLPDLDTGFTSIDCYCPPGWMSPVAWSRDERLLASLDPTGHVVIRRTCDGGTVAVLNASLPAASRAVSLAFAPDGSGIAELALTDGGHRLAYYALSRLEP